MPYAIRWKSTAEKSFLALPRPTRDALEPHIDGLEQNPRPHGCRKMAGFEDTYRIRVGDYRVVYRIDDDIRLVLVLAVGLRGGVYRHL